MTDQLTSADLKTMSPEAIVKAHRGGQLDSVLRGEEPKPAAEMDNDPIPQGVDSADQGARGPIEPAQLDDAAIKQMYREGRFAEIVEARRAGRCDDLLGISR